MYKASITMIAKIYHSTNQGYHREVFESKYFLMYHHLMEETNQTTNTNKPKTHKFICPNCGEISRDDVIFLCNTCKQDQLLHLDGNYMCPTCLVPGDNFECMLCDSKDVKMVAVTPEESEEVMQTHEHHHKH